MHATLCHVPISQDDFKVISCAKFIWNDRILEPLFIIYQFKPNLNLMFNTTIIFLFLQMYTNWLLLLSQWDVRYPSSSVDYINNWALRC